MRRGRVSLKNKAEIALLDEANRHVWEILSILSNSAVPGVTTLELDTIARRELNKRNLESPFLGYYGYPSVICASINHEIVHGIPSERAVLKSGDIIGLDFGVRCKGYVGDGALTVGVGEISLDAQKLIQVTRECLKKAIEVCTPEYRLSDIGRVVQSHAEHFGYGVVREFVGHGIGKEMHEDPQVPNYYDGPKARLKPGLVIAIEPMINAGKPDVRILEDGWTAITRDGQLSAHFEQSIAITESGPILLGAQNGGNVW